MRIKDKIRIDRNALVLLMGRIRLALDSIYKNITGPRCEGKTYTHCISKYEYTVARKLSNLIENAVIVTINRTAKVMIGDNLYTKEQYRDMIRSAYR